MSTELTPIRKQYLDIKRKHKDAILFFRLGDFYETFDEDAEIAARELDIVLTSRNVAKGARVPMAGIPHHAIENYLGRLIEKGYHVAICEQMGEGPVKGLFPRQVVRVVTPGTIVEPALLPGDANNYLAAVVNGGTWIGVAYADVSTGEFFAAQFQGENVHSMLRQELFRLKPAEVLAPDDLPMENVWEGHVTPLPAWRFELDRTESQLQDHFGTATLAGFGLAEQPWAVRAAGALVDYLTMTQASVLQLMKGISTYSLNEFMTLDASTRRNLELTETIRTGEIKGSLIGVLDATITPMGRRLLRQWIGKPLLDPDAIRVRLDQVEACYADGMWRADLRQALKPIGDVERLTNRAAAGMAGPHDLVSLRSILQHLPALKDLLDPEHEAALQSLNARLDPCGDVCDLLERAITDDPPGTLGRIGVIRSGFSRELDDILEATRDAREWIANLEDIERKRTGIKNLKVGYNKVFGYYIEVTKSNLDAVPEAYIRKQTLVNAERYITPEMKEYEAKVLTAEEEIRAVEQKLFHEICRQIGTEAERLLSSGRAVGHLDVVAGFAEVAMRKGYVRPEVEEGYLLDIRGGRHPVVEDLLPGRSFVPNDAIFEDGERIRVITGPNMSGKSTYLRQVALITLMAQMGCFVPAEKARIGITDRIFTRIGAQDEIHAGQSTLMVEMVETANILHHASERSLIILDEIGRGTSTYDGVSIAWAVVEYIHNHPDMRSRTFFATHYHELTSLSELLPGVRNYNVAVSEEGGETLFLHKIIPGGADKSYGIHVAQLAGLPRPVVQRAQEILAQLEDDSRGSLRAKPVVSEQMILFPETNPLLDELQVLDVDNLTPLEALNKFYEWRKRFLPDEAGDH